MDAELRQQPTTNESAYDSMRRSPTTPKPVPCNSTLEFRCHPERDNNNRQEDHQNCAHDLVSFFLRAAGQSQKTPTLNSAERGRNPTCKFKNLAHYFHSYVFLSAVVIDFLRRWTVTGLNIIEYGLFYVVSARRIFIICS
jgi:hypothetical protein